jgi:hypothetical protein
MNLFLKRILTFLLPIVFLLFTIEYAIRQLPNSYKTKGEFLNVNSNSVETLILGSSHTLYGLQPNQFKSKTFNASNVSQSPDVDFAILESYERLLINLKTVVIRLSYDTLFEQLKNSSEDWRLKDYKLYTDVKFDYSYNHYSELLSTSPRQGLKVLKDYYFDDQVLNNCDSLGWGNNLEIRLKPNIERAGLTAAKRHTIPSWDVLDDNIKVFENLIKWCKHRDITVLLVTPPSYKSYRDNLDQIQLNKMIEVGDNLNTKYKNCNYYNFLADNRFVAEDFFDADHLNTHGAKKFSLIINNIIEN